jgi:hypothetical protein
VSTTGTVALDALYEVQAGDHSFTALIQGGQNNVTRKALLDGVILDGWRTGARVHVEYTVISGCAGMPAGPCFEGTIRILRDSDDSHEQARQRLSAVAATPRRRTGRKRASIAETATHLIVSAMQVTARAMRIFSPGRFPLQPPRIAATICTNRIFTTVIEGKIIA